MDITTLVHLRDSIDLGNEGAAVERGEDGLPTAFRLLKFGTNESKNGPIKLDKAGASEVMTRFQKHGIKLAVDFEHQTFNTVDNGKPAPAIGWIHPEVREDGLWAIVDEWTAQGADLLRSKAYRYFSPVVGLDKASRVVELMPVALTNYPALRGLEPLTLRPKENTMEMTEEQIAKLRAADDFAGEICKLTGQADREEARKKIEAWRDAEADVAKRAKELDERERKSILSAMERDGKLPAKMRKYAEGLSLIGLRDYAEAAEPVIPTAPLTQKQPEARLSAAAKLDAQDKAIDDELKADPSVPLAIAMQRAIDKNKALFEGATINEGA